MNSKVRKLSSSLLAMLLLMLLLVLLLLLLLLFLLQLFLLLLLLLQKPLLMLSELILLLWCNNSSKRSALHVDLVLPVRVIRENSSFSMPWGGRSRGPLRPTGALNVRRPMETELSLKAKGGTTKQTGQLGLGENSKPMFIQALQ